MLEGKKMIEIESNFGGVPEEKTKKQKDQNSGSENDREG